MQYNATCLFLIFSAVQTFKTSFQIAEESTIKRPRFKRFLSSSNFQNIVHVAAVSPGFFKHSDFYESSCDVANK